MPREHAALVRAAGDRHGILPTLRAEFARLQAQMQADYDGRAGCACGICADPRRWLLCRCGHTVDTCSCLHVLPSFPSLSPACWPVSPWPVAAAMRPAPGSADARRQAVPLTSLLDINADNL